MQKTVLLCTAYVLVQLTLPASTISKYSRSEIVEELYEINGKNVSFFERIVEKIVVVSENLADSGKIVWNWVPPQKQKQKNKQTRQLI